MFNYIIKIIDENALLSYLLILLLMVIIIKMFTPTCRLESLTVDTPNIPIDYFNKFYARKNINLICKIPDDEREYYLVNFKKNVELTDNTECDNVITVLMEKNKLDADLNKYMFDLDTDKILCNMQNKIKCERTKQNIVCAEDSPECTTKRNYIHDFYIQDVTQPNDINNKYFFQGTSIPKRNNISSNTMLNQHIYSKLNKNRLCSDYITNVTATNTGDAEIMVEAILSKTENNYDNIQSSNLALMAPDMKIKLYFNTATLIPTKDGKFTNLFDSNNKQIFDKSYVGVCIADKITLSDGSKVNRVCLYPENDTTGNILEFKPVLIL
jgi:hypothetical protein